MGTVGIFAFNQSAQGTPHSDRTGKAGVVECSCNAETRRPGSEDTLCAVGYGSGEKPILRYLHAVHQSIVALARTTEEMTVSAAEAPSSAPTGKPMGELAEEVARAVARGMVNKKVHPVVVDVSDVASAEVCVAVIGVTAAPEVARAVGYGRAPTPSAGGGPRSEEVARGRISALTTALWLVGAADSGADARALIQSMEEAPARHPELVSIFDSEVSIVRVSHEFPGGHLRLRAVSKRSHRREHAPPADEEESLFFENKIEVTMDEGGDVMTFGVEDGVADFPKGVRPTLALRALSAQIEKLGVEVTMISPLDEHAPAPVYRAELRWKRQRMP